ncbi:MAG: hypothetical protein QOI11_2514, partial [Candidatus Eremiobacteraeota bacterium]|nr:hypothetical protein [Candidatus Eremiobacteraeota bacterium]
MPTAGHSELKRPYGGVSATERVSARRERLIAAGLECYGTRGYGPTGVKQVCAAAGLTHRYFYESFTDPEAHFLAVFDAVTDELFASVAVAVSTVQPLPEAQLRAAIGTFLEALADDPRKARLIFSEAAAAGTRAEEHMRATLRRFTDLVAMTARPHLPSRAPDDMVRVVALSLVGTLEQVV